VTHVSVPLEALRYEALAPPCEVGDTLLINTTAVDLGLGTGGVGFVVANLTAIERSGPLAFNDDVSAGHIMKLRYTPLQHEALSVEEPASPHHEVMQQAHTLGGIPVVCCELHSQVPLVAAAIKYVMPEARVVYCMTDEAALLASFSTLLADMRQVGLIDLSISCGQAFGADMEAVNLYSGMLAATAVCAADVIICAQGPGIVGTATRFGHGALAQAQALNAVASLGGVPIAPLRLSFADARKRHHGVSHHTLVVLGTACLAPALIPLPDDLSPQQAATVKRQLEESNIFGRHMAADVSVAGAAIDTRGLRVTTMGRAQAEDPAFFSAAYAAGILAASIAANPRAAEVSAEPPHEPPATPAPPANPVSAPTEPAIDPVTAPPPQPSAG
jgi:hypothetical protein